MSRYNRWSARNERQLTMPMRMSAFGSTRTFLVAPHMSAFRAKADMTLYGNPLLRSLLGVKRTASAAMHMSAYDPKRTLVNLRCPFAPLMTHSGHRARSTFEVG